MELHSKGCRVLPSVRQIVGTLVTLAGAQVLHEIKRKGVSGVSPFNLFLSRFRAIHRDDARSLAKPANPGRTGRRCWEAPGRPVADVPIPCVARDVDIVVFCFV